MKLCKDCLHIDRLAAINDASKCRKALVPHTSPVTGNVGWTYAKGHYYSGCSDKRASIDDPCGREGYLWEPYENNNLEAVNV